MKKEKTKRRSPRLKRRLKSGRWKKGSRKKGSFPSSRFEGNGERNRQGGLQGRKNPKGKEETRVEPASPPNQSGPSSRPPPGRGLPAFGKPGGRRCKGGGGGKEETRGSWRGEKCFWRFRESRCREKEGIPSGGGEQQARVLGGDGGTSERKPTGPSLSAVDPILLKIMRRIEEAKRYPKAARRMGIEERPWCGSNSSRQVRWRSWRVAESSGSDILDKASVETVREAAPLPYKEGWLKVGIVFKIL